MRFRAAVAYIGLGLVVGWTTAIGYVLTQPQKTKIMFVDRPILPTGLQLSCDRGGLIEWQRVCRARSRMEKVGGR